MRWRDVAGALTLKVLKATRLATGAEVIGGVEAAMTEFSGDVAGAPHCDNNSTGLNTSCGGRR